MANNFEMVILSRSLPDDNNNRHFVVSLKNPKIKGSTINTDAIVVLGIANTYEEAQILYESLAKKKFNNQLEIKIWVMQ